MTSSGNHKKEFDIVDETGNWFHCCAVGRNALANTIREGLEVVIFYASARPPAGGSPAMLYLMKDSVMVGVKPRNPVLIPAKKNQMLVG